MTHFFHIVNKYEVIKNIKRLSEGVSKSYQFLNLLRLKFRKHSDMSHIIIFFFLLFLQSPLYNLGHRCPEIPRVYKKYSNFVFM